MDPQVAVIIAALITGLFGAPVMQYLGQRFLGRMSAADKLREAEVQDRLAWRQEQQESVRSLKLEHSTLKEAHRDLEKRHGDLERKCTWMAEQIERQATELGTLREENGKKGTEILQLRERIRELEASLYRTEQELLKERQARKKLEDNLSSG